MRYVGLVLDLKPLRALLVAEAEQCEISKFLDADVAACLEAARVKVKGRQVLL